MKVKELARKRRKENPIESYLTKTVIGQSQAIAAVSAAIRRKENGWADDTRPLVMMFVGSSGVGSIIPSSYFLILAWVETETCKQMAKYLYEQKAGNDSTQLDQSIPPNLIKIDMSEFQSKHEVSKLIGAPPGYIGYDATGGLLTTKLKAMSGEPVVVLLDEVEKAHPDVLTVMLQVFDEGRLTAGNGDLVDCRNAIFVMTSNLGHDEIAANSELLRRAQELDKM